MTNFICVLVFVLGFVLILKGGDMLVGSSVKLAGKAKIPPMIVGATIVSIATTFPETTVSLVSSFRGVEEVGINTAIGSIVCNFTIVLGASFLLMPTKINSTDFLPKILYFCVCVIVLLVLGLDGKLTWIEGILLLVTLLGFIFLNIKEAKNDKTDPSQFDVVTTPWHQIIIEFLVSAFAIGLGAIVLVNNVDTISEMLGVKSGIVSFVIIAVGTNIPELVTTITSVKLKNPEIGIGNIFGASIIDCTLLIAGSVFASRANFITVSKLLLIITVPTLLLITAVITLPIIKKNKTFRLQGLALILIYIIYTYLVCVKM